MKIFIFVLFCVLIAVYDVKTFRIPDVFLVLFAAAMAAAALAEGNGHNLLAARRFMAAAFSFVLFGFVWCYTQGMGFGDVKYASVLGFFLGLENLVTACLISSCLAFCVYILGIYVSRIPKTARIPFAPFLSAGAIFAAGGGAA